MKMYSMNKTTGIIVSLIMIGLGLLAFLNPFALGAGLSYIITIGLGIYGITSIVAYFRVVPEERNGWTLANGIILTVLAGLMLWTALGNPYGSIQMITTLAFAIGLITFIGGIDQVRSYFILRRLDVPGAGWLLAGGILDLLLTAVILINPLFGWFGISIIWGIYLTMSGLVLFAESCSGRRGMSPAV